jgi:hypothetical protein
LVVIEGRESHVERFADISALSTREGQLRHEWLLNGWRPIGPDDDFDEVE